MKTGLIVAIETDAIFSYYSNIEKLTCPKGFMLYRVVKEHNEIFILNTGMGEISAAAGVQYLITACGVECIVNFGVVGGLTADMKKQKLCILDRVVHYKYDCSEFMDLEVGQVDGYNSTFLSTDRELLSKALEFCPELSTATCCSGDKFVATEAEKKILHITFEGDVCDMESAGIVLTCDINNVPCVLLKAVSDGLQDGAKGFYDELRDAALKCLEVTDKIIDNL